MKATEQYFPVVLYEVVLLLSPWMKYEVHRNEYFQFIFSDPLGCMAMHQDLPLALASLSKNSFSVCFPRWVGIGQFPE